MATVYTKQARKSKSGKRIFAPGKSDSGYAVFRLCRNYNGQVRGGIDKYWGCVADKLTLAEAMRLFEKKVGYKLYEPEQYEQAQENTAR